MFHPLNRNSFFYISLLILAFVVLVNNAFYGFGWTDEALYCATVNSVFKGQRLFFDIFEPTQIYSLLVLPFFTLFVKLTGSTDGIYLFMRIATLILQFAAGLFLYSVLSKKYSKAISLVSSLTVLIFSRAQLFGPSYYTFVLINFTIATALVFSVFALNKKRAWLFVSGLFYGFAILCNPYLVLPYIAVSLFLVIKKSLRKNTASFALVWLGTVLVGTVFLAIVLTQGNIKEFPAAIKYFFSSPEYSSKTLLQRIKWLLKFPRLLVTQFVYFLPFSVLASVSFFKKDIKARINSSSTTRTVLMILLIFNYIAEIFLLEKDNGRPVTGFFAFSILSFFLFSEKKAQDYKTEITMFLVPGLMLSFMECLSSDTGFGVFSIGIVACMPFAVKIYFDTFKSEALNRAEQLLSIVPLCLLILCTLYYRVNLTYRDIRISPHFVFIPSIEKNIEKIDNGPAKGLWTAMDNRRQYNSIYSTVKNINASDGEMIMVAKLCPWAYLVNKELTPFSMTAWRISADDLRLKPYFEEFNHRFPDYVLILDKTIRDNFNNEIADTSYLINKLKKNDYTPENTSCGVLWKKR